ncbi:MAG: hypothetical protein R6U44_01465 [Archaeoglobaceae archaeon]
MINPKILIIVAALSAVLNVATQEQVESTPEQVEMEDFLEVASKDALEFEYFNCTTDEIADYVGMASKGDQIARFFLDGGYVIVTEGKANPLYNREEEYRGISLKLQDEYCWAEMNGLTLYGHVGRVKLAIDHYKTNNTLRYYVKENGIEQVNHADYLWLVKGGYCPFSHQLKALWAYYEKGDYEFYRLDGEDDRVTKKSFDQFYQVINAKKYRKNTMKIEADMGNKKMDIEVM